jgi:hypothetical protein
MDNASERKKEEALREYLEAVDNHNRILDKYFPMRPLVPGKPITFGEPITPAAFKEIEEAETKVAKALEKWHRLMDL